MASLSDAPNPIGIRADVVNQGSGGPGGTAFTLTDDANPVKKLTVWVARGGSPWTDRDLVKAIKVEWKDGKQRAQGNQTGNAHSFTFDEGETVTALDLWTGDRVDRISMTTSEGRTFDHGGKYGNKHSEELGNGVLIGFVGSAGENELVSLGAIFKEASD
jgi:hypothetical protein